MGWESFDMVTFDLGPFLQGRTRTFKLKSAYNSLIIRARAFKCETNLQEIKPNFKVLITRFSLVLVVCNVKSSYINL